MELWAPHVSSQILCLRKLRQLPTLLRSHSFSHLQTMFSFLGCSDSTEDVAAVSGKTLWLRPSNIQTKNVSVEWKMKLQDSKFKILIYYHYNKKQTEGLNDIYDFNLSDFALGIKSAKLEDSGYYELEITNDSGGICTKRFRILILGEFLALLTLPL